jgi:hypothetical protein
MKTKRTLGLLLLLTSLLISCGKKEYKKEFGLGSNSDSRNNLEVDTPERNDDKPLINTSELAILNHSETNTRVVDDYIIFDLTIKNIGKLLAKDLVIISNIYPFYPLSGEYDRKCGVDLEPEKDCLIKVKVKANEKKANTVLKLAYYNGEGRRILDIALSHQNNTVVTQDDDKCEELTVIDLVGKNIVKKSELGNLQLPYKFSSPHTDQITTLLPVGVTNFRVHLMSQGMVKDKILKTFETVRDGQVVFSYQIPANILAQAKNIKVRDLEMEVSFEKIFLDSYPHTEMFCLLGLNLCSGQLYEDREFTKLINENFWVNTDLQLRNSIFSKYVLSKYSNKEGVGISRSSIKISVAEILSLKDADLSSILHGSKLYFAFVDDLKIRENAKLRLTIGSKKKACISESH